MVPVWGGGAEGAVGISISLMPVLTCRRHSCVAPRPTRGGGFHLGPAAQPQAGCPLPKRAPVAVVVPRLAPSLPSALLTASALLAEAVPCAEHAGHAILLCVPCLRFSACGCFVQDGVLLRHAGRAVQARA